MTGCRTSLQLVLLLVLLIAEVVDGQARLEQISDLKFPMALHGTISRTLHTTTIVGGCWRSNDLVCDQELC